MHKREPLYLGLYIITLLVALMVAVISKTSMAPPFFFGLLVLPLLLHRLGYGLRPLGRSFVQTLVKYRSLFAIICLMGITIGLWLSSGAVPALIYYSAAICNALNLVFLAFVLCGVFSMVVGTALGTISTFGIALLTIGKSAGIPEALVLGAIVSGAFMADRLSPVAGLVNLNLSIHGIAYSDLLKASLKRVGIAASVAGGLFFVLGLPYIGSGTSADQLAILEALDESFNLSPWLMLIPLVVVALSLLKRPIVEILSIMAVLMAGISYGYQSHSLINVLKTVLWGFQADNVLLKTMIKGGGFIPYLEVIVIVACAIGVSALLEETKAYQDLAIRFLTRVKGRQSLARQVGLMSLLMTSLTCDQTIGIVTPARLYKEKCRDFGCSPAWSASAIADTGIVVAPLEPWNVNTLMITAMTGVSVFSYGPYAFFLVFLIALYFFETTLIKTEV